MDDYLKCLYGYILENLSTNAHKNTTEYINYTRCRTIQAQALEALRDSLTPAQIQLLEAYESAKADTLCLEDIWYYPKPVLRTAPRCCCR